MARPAGALRNLSAVLPLHCLRIDVAVEQRLPSAQGPDGPCKTLNFHITLSLAIATMTGSSCGVGYHDRMAIRKNLCKHSGCAMPWAQWSQLVEQKYSAPMRLDGEIKWKK